MNQANISLISSLITAFTAIAAIMTAIATFLTVRQLKKQTEASYRPELAFLQTTLFAYPDSDGIPSRWLTHETEDNSDISHNTTAYSSMYFDIQMYNIGLGTAKNVVYSWDFPVRDLVEQVNTNAQRALEAAYYKYENGMLSLESTKFRQSTIMWENERRQTTIGYVLPSEVNRDGIAVRIPATFIDLVSSHIYFSWQAARRNKQKVILNQIPPLTMSLIYHDIAGAKYNRTFTLRLNIGAILGAKRSETDYRFGEFRGYIVVDPSTPGAGVVDWKTVRREGLRLLESVARVLRP